jgi:hypothetical protein
MGSICSDFNPSLIAMFALKAIAKNIQKNIFQYLGSRPINLLEAVLPA